MNCNTQNEKIEMLTDEWLIVGIDVGSEKHFARMFNNRKVELSRKALGFENDEKGFTQLEGWISNQLRTSGKKFIMCAMEPTGHYWYNLTAYLQAHGMVVVHVSPSHVKKSKELDDNNPNKNDRKDPKTIAGLVTEGRYMIPYMPNGIYASIRELNNMRMRATESLIVVKNRLARWFSIYFPEFTAVFGDLKAKSSRLLLAEAPLPEDVIKLGAEGVNRIFRNAKLRSVGMKKALQIVEAAEHSIGRKENPWAAREEISELLEDLDRYLAREEKLMARLHEEVMKVPNVERILEIKGIGIRTVSGFIAEVGDISRFEDAKSIQKLSGYAIVANESGKHNGQSSISYRGRKILRYFLFQAAISVIGKNPEFAVIHEYYTTRKKNPLKKMQSVIAVACKLIRVLYTILTKGVRYDGQKMLNDIVRPETIA